jgi:hypothetical protein
VKIGKVSSKQEGKIHKDFVEFERNFTKKVHKIAVLRIDPKNTVNLAEMSPEFSDFLEFVAEKITLNNWKGFSGNLDTTSQESNLYPLQANFADIFFFFF